MGLLGWLAVSWGLATLVIIGIMCAGRSASLDETHPERMPKDPREFLGKKLIFVGLSDRQVERKLIELAADTGLIWLASREEDGAVVFEAREPGVDWPDEEEIDGFLQAAHEDWVKASEREKQKREAGI